LFAFPRGLFALQFTFNLPVGNIKHAQATKVSTDQPRGKLCHAKIFIVIDVKPFSLLDKKNCLILFKRLITAINQLIFDCRLKVLLVENDLFFSFTEVL